MVLQKIAKCSDGLKRLKRLHFELLRRSGMCAAIKINRSRKPKPLINIPTGLRKVVSKNGAPKIFKKWIMF